jgi:hypothetical protein
MTFSAAGRRLAESPEDRFLPRDWLTLLAICLLAVVIRASVMALLPSILHPDELLWLEQANRLVNHRGFLPWDFQVGERSWLWPGLIAGFMAIGQLFGSPPDAGLGGVAVLICILSLAPVICGFLWGRNVAGFPGAVITGLLIAVWFELVYFYAHPLSESAAGAFRSLRDLRWFERFLALQRNPLGRRVIQWLIRAGAGDDPQPPSAASRRMTSL